mmetsp:Transcript_14976/g.23185  ORF Transcript_14976/g.23185 Transcript_14976/m.23185 type:complete len:103 (+) Transcript_14976:159-467(+)|eukprot:CAMPEP_0170498316 /NCGR_PEP_ID=MMETSP0208-20121228/27439_1 /TAXON_ID=197538 /ORGANISM="Strombidium inclinatum, Strain S3" /LENGTH=102 /DNA_ID=CAMNT_0010775451 /DNA_START=147 /DNA_END=455 /DNA_ORIENTATION=-
MAKLLMVKGVTLIILDEQEAKFKAALSSLEGVENATSKVDIIKCNLADSREVERVFRDEVTAKHGRVQVLINNAAIALLKPFTATSFEEHCHSVQVNQLAYV